MSQPVSATDHRRWDVEPALVLLLACLVFLGLAGALALRSAHHAAERVVDSRALALAYDEAALSLMEAELLRHEVLTGDARGMSLAAQLDVTGQQFLQLEKREGEPHAGHMREVRQRYAAYRSAALRGAVDDRAADRTYDTLLDRLSRERKDHHGEATADRDQVRSRIVSLQIGLAVMLALVAVTGVLAAKSLTEGRRRLESYAEVRTHESRHDPLTGLPNRRALTERLDRGLGQHGDDRGTVAVIWIDLDDFKVVNDTHGHDAGDQLLREVGQRLKASVRPSDMVARFGGDEFVILCDEMPEPGVARRLAERLADELRRPLTVGNTQHVLGGSIGVAHSPMPDTATMLSAADTAMYRAKRLGGSGVVVFDHTMRDADLDRFELGADLADAAARGELRLHYQPIVDLSSGAPLGVEALVRWQHPSHGLLGPGQFLAVAEETGAIVKIGAWVIEEAVGTLSSWQTQDDGYLSKLSIAVNLSARQLADLTLVDVVSRALHRHAVPAERLTLEVTESMVMAQVDSAIDALEALRRLGVRIAIDDFGTGYSSLSYLKQLPVDTLKLDRSFITGVGSDARDSSIVSAVVGLCSATNLALVAEGIETPRQRDALRALGCRVGQGFLWSRPLERSAVERWLRDTVVLDIAADAHADASLSLTVGCGEAVVVGELSSR